MPADSPRRADRPAAVALAYALIAVVMTWPLARYLGTRLAADVGDPAFNSWVLAWTAGQILAALSGDVGALASYWHGNIFTPEPLWELPLSPTKRREKPKSSCSSEIRYCESKATQIGCPISGQPTDHRLPVVDVPIAPRSSSQ